MFNCHSKKLQSIFFISLMLVLVAGVSACKNEPPKLMKAVTQFDSDEIRDAHVKRMRKHHMDDLLHKRDETMIKGIRTDENSLKACINCHVPKKHNGKILRHTDPEHFCATCHVYVAQELDCFQCHVDHPTDNSKVTEMPKDTIHKKTEKLSSFNKEDQTMGDKQ